MRSGPKVKTTSSDVISSPLWNFTPLRSDSSTVRSSIRFQLSASPGIDSRFFFRSRAIRFSNSDCCTRSPTLERSRTTSSEALVATCCTAMVMLGLSSVWPMAKRGKISPPAVRPMKRRRSTGCMLPPVPLVGTMKSQCYSISWQSEGRNRRLRHVLPEIGIVPEEQRRAALLQLFQPAERRKHLVAIVDEAQQATFSQGTAEIAGVAGQHDLAVLSAHLERLMTRRVAVGGNADHAAVAEQVVLALDLLHRMAVVEIGLEEADLGGGLGISRRLPFAPLNHDGGIGHELVAAGMVEMQVRVDDEVDLAGITVDRFQLRLHVIVRTEMLEPEEPRGPLADPAGGVAAQLRVHAGIEQCPPLGMLDHVGRDRQVDLSILALDHVLQAADQAAAGHGVQLCGHVPV